MLTVEEGSDWGAQCKIPPQGSLIIGRSATCDLVLDDERASRQHFRFEVINGRYFVTDLGSRNGTFVNEEKISDTTPVSQDDRIRVGGSIMRVSDAAVGTLIGKVIGGCRLEERLGSGGMGEVYRATQISLGRIVAVKVLAADLADDEEFIQQFLAEARSAGQFNHPHVVQVYDVGNEGGLYFYSMEYQSGGSVQQHVQGGKTLAPARVLQVIKQAASALEFAEQMGIVHCDIKPENLMLNGDGDVRVADLGIARKHGETAASKDSMHVAGSPHYMSPEQAKGEKLDNRSDLYALGATMYRLLAGRPPFNGNSAREVMEKQVFEDAYPIRKIRPQIPAPIATIVAKLLQKKPEKRYQRAKELIADLDKASASAGKAVAGDETSEVARITSFRIRVPGSGVSILSKALAWVLIVGVILGVAYGGLRHIYRADRLYERAVQLQRAGRLDDAKKLFEEALRVAGEDSTLGMRIEQRLDEVHGEMDAEDERERAEKTVREAEIMATGGKAALAKAFEKAEAVMLSSAIGKEVATDVVTKLRTALEEEADGELGQRTREAEHLVAEYRYAEAIKLLRGFPQHYARTKAYLGASDKAAEIRTRADAAFKGAVAKAEETILEAGTRTTAEDDAIQHLLPFIHRSGIPEIASRARSLRMQMEMRAKQIREDIKQKEIDNRVARLDAELAESRLLAHLYRFAESRVIVRRVQNLLRDMGMAQRVADLDTRVDEIARSEILFSSLRSRLASGKLNDQLLVVTGRPAGKIAGYRRRADSISLKRSSGGSVLVPLAQVSPQQIAKLMLKIPLKPYDHIVLAEFLIEHGASDEAGVQIGYANRVRPGERAITAMIRAKVAGGTATRPEAADAQTLAALVEKAARAGRREDAKAHLELLATRYSQTPSGSEANRARLQGIIDNPNAGQ